MDPVTHGIIGLGIAALSGQPVNPTNPIILGSIIGAMAPDLDIIAKYKGDYEYLKHHRGFSHSILGLIGISGIISLLLGLVFSGYSFIDIMIWTFLGSMSHTFFDILNSYGVRCLLPISKKKISASLLMLYDPFITALCLGLAFIDGSTKVKGIVGLVFLSSYLGFRFFTRRKILKILKNKFNLGYDIIRINVLPSMLNPFKWDFIIEAKSHDIVGEINSINYRSRIKKELKKKYHSLIEELNYTKLGKYFSDFTPIRHFRVIDKGNKLILHAIDLRYYFKNNFMHHATIIFNKDIEVIREIFHPYNYNNEIVVSSEEVG